MMGRRSPRRFERQDSRYNARGFIPRRFRKFDFVRLRKCSLDCWTYAYVLAPVGRVVEWDEDKDSRLIVVKATNGPFGGLPMHPESGVPPSTSTSIQSLAALIEESDDLWFSISIVEFGEDHHHELEPFTRVRSRPPEESSHPRAEWQAEEATAAQRQLVSLWGTQLTFFIRHEHQYDDPNFAGGDIPTLTRRASLQVPRHLQRAKTATLQRRATDQEETEVSDATSWSWIPNQLRRHVGRDADGDAEGAPATQPPPPPYPPPPGVQPLEDGPFGSQPSSRPTSRPPSRPPSKPPSRPASSCERRRPSCERRGGGRFGALL